jgi:hypothetical protein
MLGWLNFPANQSVDALGSVLWVGAGDKRVRHDVTGDSGEVSFGSRRLTIGYCARTVRIFGSTAALYLQKLRP